MSATILIVDDEPVQRRLLENTVTKLGYKPILATGGEAALELLDQGKPGSIDAVVLDLVMPDLDGMGVLSRMRQRGHNLPVIVQTAQGGVDTAVGAMRAGAFDFVIKPASPERLQVSLQNALKLGALEGAVKRIKKTADGKLGFGDMVAAAPSMQKVIRLGERAAASNIPILIEGESGVGKEIIARAIQGSGERKSKPLITMNCGAISPNLVESLLFGHEKGAFTGANDKHIGKFQEADGGTLFLDEVGELPLDVQVKLLRAIQEGEIDPVGASKPVKTDFRLISATNKNLLEEVKAGNFREDLFYRLNVFPIWIPPLRDRREDIPQLVRHFTAKISAEEGRGHISGIRSDAMEMLIDHDWPGNIRQLENAIFRAVVLCDSKEMSLDDFPQIAAQSSNYSVSVDEPNAMPEPDEQSDGVISFKQPNAAVVETFQPEVSAKDIPAGLEPLTGGTSHYALMPLLSDMGELRSLEDIEENLIRFSIDHHQGRMTKVARSLGIGRSTLYRKLKQYGIDHGGDQQAAE